MRIEYAITLGKDGPKITHRVITGGDDSGGVPVPTGVDPGGVPVPTGVDPGGVPVPTGVDPGGVPVPTGVDPGGGITLGSGCETIIVLGPTIITGGGWPQGSSGAKPLPTVPSTFNVEAVADRPAQKTFEAVDPSASSDVIPEAKMRGQEHWYWCWAAVGSAVRKFMDAGQPLNQCEVADMVMANERPGTALASCCLNPGSSNLPKSLWATLTLLDNLQEGIAGGVATFDLIKQEIAAGRPIGARIAWDTYNDGLEDGAHFVLIAGWEVVNGVEKVKILDPAVGLVNQADAERPRVVPTVEPHSVPYEQFRHAYKGTGKWVVSYFVKGISK